MSADDLDCLWARPGRRMEFLVGIDTQDSNAMLFEYT